nr:MAG TPA: hypothetical protein [Caudoviricetes sp.]
MCRYFFSTYRHIVSLYLYHQRTIKDATEYKVLCSDAIKDTIERNRFYSVQKDR